MATDTKVENKRSSRWTTVQVAIDGGGKSFDVDAKANRWDACAVEPALFIGSLSAAMNRPALDAFGITHILSVMHDWRREKEGGDEFVRKFVEVQDNAGAAVVLAAAFQECYTWIRDALKDEGRVLVHCQAGISRSSTMMCSYLMQCYCLSMDDALKQIRHVRPMVMPNSAFLQQLRTLERSLQCDIKHNLSTALPNNNLAVRIVLAFLNIEAQNLDGQIITIRQGDTFHCKRFKLPSHLSITSSSTNDNDAGGALMPVVQWEVTTVHIDPKRGSWCILRVEGIGNGNWLLLQESTPLGDDSFEYTLYTIPHLVGNQPSADEDHASIVLPNFTLHRISSN